MREGTRTAAQQSASGLSSVTPARWQSRLTAHLERCKRTPADARRRGERGTVHVRFTIDGGGNVRSVSRARSSGYPALDNEVFSFVRPASPVPVRAVRRQQDDHCASEVQCEMKPMGIPVTPRSARPYGTAIFLSAFSIDTVKRGTTFTVAPIKLDGYQPIDLATSLADIVATISRIAEPARKEARATTE